MRRLGWLVLVLLSACGPQPEIDREELLRELSKTADPEAYRAEVKSLEASLFRDDGLRPGEADGIAFSLREISRRVREVEQSRLGNISAGQMENLADRIDSGFGGIAHSRGAMREGWMRIRGSLFSDAVWFRWRPGDAPVTVAAAPTVDARALADLEHVLRRLEGMARDGRRACSRLGEPKTDSYYMQNKYKEDGERWRSWGRDWREKLESVRRTLPPKPSSTSGVYYFYAAYRNTENAIGKLEMVPAGRGGWGFPFRREWEKRFEEAEEQLAKASEYLESIQG